MDIRVPSGGEFSDRVSFSSLRNGNSPGRYKTIAIAHPICEYGHI